MIGVEIVKDKRSKLPATAETKFIVDELKEQFILIGTDGKHDNVIKIKPPMCFN
jgi:4-aminobutyrate aminotransferase-like enzyme